MLSVDRGIVQDNIPSFISALCMMFGSYYCFNIHCPSELASTLEFLQRCFFSINPEKGTKSNIFSLNNKGSLFFGELRCLCVFSVVAVLISTVGPSFQKKQFSV
ncbi:hypothetical protein MHYP_G00245060 [Metynnis hypsauchen]